MANEEAENKNIAKLSFNVDDAINNLNKIDKKLKTLSESSELYAKKIGENINKSIQNVSFIDTDKVKEEADKSIKINQDMISEAIKNDKVLKRKLILQNNEHNNTIAQQNNKARLKQEANNEMLLKSTQTIYDKIANYAKTYLIYSGFNELKRISRELIDEMVEVEYQMVQIDRVLNDSSINIENYRDKLIQLAYDYGNSFDNVADITLRLAQAGFDAQESLAMTEKTLLALNTAELDATQATSDMVAVMSQWGLMTGSASEQAEAYGSIIDKINKVADNYPTTSEDLMNALKKTSSAFNIAGASIDETIALITAAEVASQRGGKAIGTALSNITQQLKDAGRMTTMESLGIDVYTDATKTEFKNIMEILEQLSGKMQQLKNDGKENSAEMQNLLEVFTVFRRNIGAGLLGEMAGEDSTYAKVLEDSINSVGYSLQENEKHMKTAKAAQEQFNATLLQLKTEVWDNGVEDVFRSLLLLGTDLVKSINWLVETFGSIPTVIGTVTLAFTSLNKNMRLANNVSVIGVEGTKKIVRQYNDWVIKIKEVIQQIKNQNTYITKTNSGNIKLKTSISGVAKDMGRLAGQTALATVKTLALEAATIALNTAMSLGISLAITAIVNAIDSLIHAEEKYIEKIDEEISKTQEKIDVLQEEQDSINDLINEYQELSEKSDRTPEENKKIYELQLKINQELSDQGKYIDFSNLKYDEQLKKLKEITLELKKQEVEEKSKKAREVAGKKTGVGLNAWESTWGGKSGDIEKTLRQAGIDIDRAKELHLGKGTGNVNFGNFFNYLNFNEQLAYLTEWEQKLKEAGMTATDTYKWVSESLEEVTRQQKEATDAANEFYRAAAELRFQENFENLELENVQQYQEILSALSNMEIPEEYKVYKDTLIDLFQNKFPEFANEAKLASGELSALDSVIDTQLTKLQNLSDQYNLLRQAQDEYNKSGEMTIATLQGLIDNDLLQYLSLQNGQLQINAQSLLNAAEAAKVKAIQELQDAAAMDIQYVATGKLDQISNIAKGAIAGVGTNAQNAGEKMQSATSMANNFAASLQNVINASKGELGDGVDPNTFQKQANAIVSSYQNLAKNIAAINIKTASYTPKKISSSGSGGSSYSSSKTDAQKQAEEEYKARLKAFEDFVKDREELEERWVKKQDELGELSNKDFLYITQQRIKRYEQYLAQVKKMTWLNAEDRKELEKEYAQEIEDLQLDYMQYLREQLDDQIDALKEANEEKIKLIEEEADARIEALRKVEDENDRIRTKEEYLKEREQHLNDISYWEQRTGREAQEALKEAKANLKELDEEWEQQLEDWSIEDQIAAIEAERDAQIKAIEEAQQ